MYGVWVPKRPHWVWHATFFRCMPTGWWQDWFEIWNVQLYLQYMICIVLKVNILIYFAIMITWLHIPNLQHAADTAKTESNVHVIFKITSLQFRCLKISQAVDCHIGSFASSGSYLASFDGSQNRWFLAMVRNCAGLKSLKTYREELDLSSLNLIWMSLKSLPFWWGNLRVFGSERTLAAWRFHPPKPTAHSDSNSQQKKKAWKRTGSSASFVKPVQITPRFLFHFFQIATSTGKPMFVGFPTNSGSTRPQNVDRMTRWFPKKSKAMLYPTGYFGPLSSRIRGTSADLKNAGLVEHPRVCWSIRHVLSGFLAYLYAASKLQVVIWQLNFSSVMPITEEAEPNACTSSEWREPLISMKGEKRAKHMFFGVFWMFFMVFIDVYFGVVGMKSGKLVLQDLPEKKIISPCQGLDLIYCVYIYI